MQRDKRQIQTAVLGSADSEEPLVLPLEAIELGAFRAVHENESRITTACKTYTWVRARFRNSELPKRHKVSASADFPAHTARQKLRRPMLISLMTALS
ncbi:hypothetical protein ACIF6K_28710 [Streptomyces sp. NPDC085942]|uniref:hypothetical protein n=1 Tax=Streptomyces sp. NPDC085942 TaxID=3365743 RepID=UPI0037D1407E